MDEYQYLSRSQKRTLKRALKRNKIRPRKNNLELLSGLIPADSSIDEEDRIVQEYLLLFRS